MQLTKNWITFWNYYKPEGESPRGDALRHRNNIFPSTVRSSRSRQFSLKSNHLKSQISNLKSQIDVHYDRDDRGNSV
ncbi:hypothetical protein QUB10_23675 [Microcoleus sp. B5-D4]|uniref:hypothetical protein n=1 Tax=unclassified Microcoleus TaxID=2642155 RepID=UPI002FCFB63F